MCKFPIPARYPQSQGKTRKTTVHLKLQLNSKMCEDSTEHDKVSGLPRRECRFEGRTSYAMVCRTLSALCIDLHMTDGSCANVAWIYWPAAVAAALPPRTAIRSASSDSSPLKLGSCPFCSLECTCAWQT